MQDFNALRTNMVDNQIRTNDVTNIALLDALLEVPRESFANDVPQELTYLDEDIALGNGRFLMEPAPFAKLVQACSIKPTDLILDVACANGYSTAVFSKLGSLVIGLEEDEDLAANAEKTLDALDYDNTAIVKGDLVNGFAKEGPYDVIFIGGAVGQVPQTLFDQLNEGGRLVAVEGNGNAAVAKLYIKTGSDVSGRSIFNCAIKPLAGFYKSPEFAL
ncbi:MAG: protein-L-isoaspartate O-methyltransferase [Nitratireductor sp.]